MKDGYRYFISHPTAEDGNPVPTEQSGPSYFRVPDTGDSPIYMPVDFLGAFDWRMSAIQPYHNHIEDLLCSGATVRELLDEKDVPHA